MALENGRETCNCVKIHCERHGKCAECMAHHEKHRRYPPYCKRKSRVKQKKALPAVSGGQTEKDPAWK
ncbi:MAG: hypothetical protein GX485_02485 [Clostridiales bacterium]|jgi:hypothetical protein|nr:hypothetical protein [Clostridiales bacterium]